jgi:hypothetical protein
VRSSHQLLSLAVIELDAVSDYPSECKAGIVSQTVRRSVATYQDWHHQRDNLWSAPK